VRIKRYFAAFACIGVLALAGFGSTASAQTRQNGLVNISLTNTTVQIPVGLAANICGLNVAAIATLVQTDSQTTCFTTADSQAVMIGSAPAGSTTQNGLVNVSLTNTTIQVPIAAAINLCGVNVAILAVLQQTASGAICDATAHSHAGG
jgi:hypothetical protein